MEKVVGHIESIDEQAFELLFRQYYSRLCLFANKFLSDMPEAEEIVQDVFLNIWNKRGRFNQERDIKPYLFKSVQNMCFNFIEHQKVIDNYYEAIELLYRNQPLDSNTYESVLYTEFQERVDQSIGLLPEECRKIFLLSRYEGLKYVEIAEKLGISIKTVETQMCRALSKLRTELKDYLAIIIAVLLLGS